MKGHPISSLRFDRGLPMLEAKPKQKRPVTICIAAIAEHDLIIGASDTMMTDEAKGIEFELKPSTRGFNFVNKISPVTGAGNVFALTAGSAGLQAEILLEMIFHTHKASGKSWTVKEIVDLYCHFYGKLKMRRTSRAILNPLGLDENTFISRQKEMDAEFIQKTAHEILNFPMEAAETIITGVDEEGSHIYRLQGNNSQCCDTVGFCAIGSGALHAESQFMLSGYNRTFTQEEAFWLMYLAKRKSEIAPGVGKDTNFFTISRKTKRPTYFNNFVDLHELGEIFKAFESEQGAAFEKARAAFKQHLEKRKPPEPD